MKLLRWTFTFGKYRESDDAVAGDVLVSLSGAHVDALAFVQQRTRTAAAVGKALVLVLLLEFRRVEMHLTHSLV